MSHFILEGFKLECQHTVVCKRKGNWREGMHLSNRGIYFSVSSKVHEDAYLFTQRVWISLCLSRRCDSVEENTYR